MTTLTPTKLDGATAKASATIYVEPQAQMTEDRLPDALVDSELNADFVTDLLSAMLTHARCGTHLYRSVAARTNNPMLQGKYEHYGRDNETYVEVLEALITRLGGNPNYVSPMARAVQASDTKLLESTYLVSGSLDPMTQEAAMLDAVFIAEFVAQAHYDLMTELGNDTDAGEVKDALEEAVAAMVLDGDPPLEWARTTKARMVMLQAKSSVVAEPDMKMEEMVATVRAWFD